MVVGQLPKMGSWSQKTVSNSNISYFPVICLVTKHIEQLFKNTSNLLIEWMLIIVNLFSHLHHNKKFISSVFDARNFVMSQF